MGKGKKKERWFWRPSWSVGWRSTAPKPQHLPTSSASDGEGVGGGEARERERDERGGVKQEMGHHSFFFLFSKSSSGHGRARIPRKVSHLNVNSLRQFRPTGSENPATQL